MNCGQPGDSGSLRIWGKQRNSSYITLWSGCDSLQANFAWINGSLCGGRWQFAENLRERRKQTAV